MRFIPRIFIYGEIHKTYEKTIPTDPPLKDKQKQIMNALYIPMIDQVMHSIEINFSTLV